MSVPPSVPFRPVPQSALASTNALLSGCGVLSTGRRNCGRVCLGSGAPAAAPSAAVAAGVAPCPLTASSWRPPLGPASDAGSDGPLGPNLQQQRRKFRSWPRPPNRQKVWGSSQGRGGGGPWGSEQLRLQ